MSNESATVSLIAANVAVVSALGLLLRNSLSSYLDVKARNLATREDFSQLLSQTEATTRATEAIRTRLGGDLWLTQERWKQRVDLYARLLESLDTTIHELETALDESMATDESQALLREAAQHRRRARALASLLSPQTYELLRERGQFERVLPASHESSDEWKRLESRLENATDQETLAIKQRQLVIVKEVHQKTRAGIEEGIRLARADYDAIVVIAQKEVSQLQ